MLPSLPAKGQRSGSGALVALPGRDVVWLSGLAYASLDSCGADYSAANGEIVRVPMDGEVLSVDVQEMDDLPLLLQTDGGWNQGVCSIDDRLDKKCGQYRIELAALKKSVPRTPLEIVKIGRELFSSHIALGDRCGKAESFEPDDKVAREAADVKLAKARSDTIEVVELRKRQTASDVSVEGLTAELTSVKAQLVQVTAEKYEFSTRLVTVVAEFEEDA